MLPLVANPGMEEPRTEEQRRSPAPSCHPGKWEVTAKKGRCGARGNYQKHQRESTRNTNLSVRLPKLTQTEMAHMGKVLYFQRAQELPQGSRGVFTSKNTRSSAP